MIMGTTGTWCRFYGGENNGDIVRSSSAVCSNPFDHIFSGFDHISVDHNNDFSEKKAFLSPKKDDPDAADNVRSTASSPRVPQHEKFLPISPKKEYDESFPKEIVIKSEANDESPSKICPSPKPAVMKRRKNQERSIACVPLAAGSWNKQGGAGVASDHWSWRKYGQKPIKGSPYPRGYYRCSSSKGCPARKQVERSRTDPTMIVITYTADHNHASPAHRRSSSSSSSGKEKPLKEEELGLELELEEELEDANHIHHELNLISPPNNEEAEHEQAPNYSECLHHDSEWLHDQQLLISANDDMIFHDDLLFQTFEDFPSLFQRDFDSRASDEENDYRMADPFNLFHWSFPTNQWWPNS